MVAHEFPFVWFAVAFVAYTALLFWISHLTNTRASSKAPWPVVAYGMIGASISGVTFISVPGNVWVQNFFYMPLVLGFVVGYVIIAKVLLPLYYRMGLTSIYTYLGERMGKASEKTGSVVFFISRLLGAAVRVFVVIVVLFSFIPKSLTGENSLLAFAIVSAVFLVLLYLYTYRGAVKTLIWTDVLQTTFMLLAVVLTIFYICRDMGWNLGTMFSALGSSLNGNAGTVGYGRPFTAWFDWNWSNGTNAVKQFVSGIFVTVAMTGLEQKMFKDYFRSSIIIRKALDKSIEAMDDVMNSVLSGSKVREGTIVLQGIGAVTTHDGALTFTDPSGVVHPMSRPLADIADDDPIFVDATMTSDDMLSAIAAGQAVNLVLSEITKLCTGGKRMAVTDIYNIIDSSTAISSADADTLRRLARQICVEGYVSPESWLNAVRTFYSEAVAAAEANTFELDTSSPFFLANWVTAVLDVVVSVLVDVFQQLLMYANNVYLRVVGALWSLVSNIVKATGVSNTVQVDSNPSSSFVKGAILAYTSPVVESPGDAANGLGIYFSNPPEYGTITYCSGSPLVPGFWWADQTQSKINCNAYLDCCVSPRKLVRFLASNFQARRHTDSSDPVDAYIAYIGNESNLPIPPHDIDNDLLETFDLYLDDEERSLFQVDNDFATLVYRASVMALCIPNLLYSIALTPDRTIQLSKPTNDGFSLVAEDNQYTAWVQPAIVPAYNGKYATCLYQLACFLLLRIGLSIRYQLPHMLEDEVYFNAHIDQVLPTIENCTQILMAARQEDPNDVSLSERLRDTLGNEFDTADYVTGFSSSDDKIRVNIRSFFYRTVQLLPFYCAAVWPVQGVYIQAIEIPYSGGDSVFLKECIDFWPSPSVWVPTITTDVAIAQVATAATLAAGTVLLARSLSRYVTARRQVRKTATVQALNDLRKSALDNPHHMIESGKYAGYSNREAFVRATASYNRKASFFGWDTYDAVNARTLSPGPSTASSVASTANVSARAESMNLAEEIVKLIRG